MDDIRAVMDAVGSESAAVMGESEGGPLAILFAAAHPERTRALILQGGEVRERTDEDWPWGEATPEEFEADVAPIPERWGKGTRHGCPRPVDRGRPAPARVRGVVGEGPAQLGDAGGAGRRSRGWRSTSTFATSSRSIHVPTLIIHATGDRVCHVENARWLAAHIPGARYVEMPGGDHLPWFHPDRTLAEIREFLTGSREPEEPDRVLATILFTDIVGSTELATTLGDRRWRDLLESHHAAVRAELARYRGREVDTAGDGFLAVFDGPARAIRAARAIVEAVRALGLEVRAGIHTGEVEQLPNGDIRGIAVHIGARVCRAAGPSEVLVSSSVRDLVAGSGLHLRGSRQPRAQGRRGGAAAYAVAALRSRGGAAPSRALRPALRAAACCRRGAWHGSGTSRSCAAARRPAESDLDERPAAVARAAGPVVDPEPRRREPLAGLEVDGRRAAGRRVGAGVRLEQLAGRRRGPARASRRRARSTGANGSTRSMNRTSLL